MAMSFTRPDPSSPASVADAGFSTGRRGFDQSEVRDFLRMVAAELGRLQERERFLERELRTAQSNPDFASVQLDDQTLTRLLGEETARVLTTARESAAEIRQKAEQSAAQMLSEASDEAARVREEAEIEASRRRSDAGADAEAELSMAKQQGREMVNEARAYRERVLSELARRRELAREQIEQLLHGRDRLMQSFERARLVAVDVVAELQPLGEPDEYVNLSPTTGPVPVMLPNTPRPGPPEAEAETETETDADAVVEVEVDAEVDVDMDIAAEVEVDVEADVTDVTDDTDGEVAVDADDADAEDADDGVDVDVDITEVDTAEVDDAEMETSDDAEMGAGDEADEPRDDVVVDLFARLRAGTSPASHASDPAAIEASPAVDDEPGADTDTASNTEVDPTAAAEAQSPAESDAQAESGAGTVDELVEASAFEQRDADLTPLIVSSAKRIKRVLADEQNEVLDALRRQEPVRSLDALLPPVSEHLKRYRASIVDDLLVAANAGAAVAGRAHPLRKADAAKAVSAADAVLDEWVTVPLRERLERCIADGDGDNAGITRRVRAVYREWKTQHIDEQLDDVIRTAHGRGVFAAVAPGTPIVWAADPSRAACADCDDNTLAGAVAAGEAFPTGHLFAPAHLGCRCLLLRSDG